MTSTSPRPWPWRRGAPSARRASPRSHRTIDPALPHLLADTWWFGLTRRMPDPVFDALADQRVAEGFTAVQLVAGIPPEVAPGHPDAASTAGPAWTPGTGPNAAYLALARRRIARLVDRGLHVVVYGAWGHHVDLVGVAAMRTWWTALIATLDDLDVTYCLTGESDLWVRAPGRLGADRSTDDLQATRVRGRLRTTGIGARAVSALRPGRDRLRDLRDRRGRSRRRARWTAVLEHVAGLTTRPLLLHPVPGVAVGDAVARPELLAASTAQTGHDPATRPLLWQLPLAHHRRHPDRPFVNLEPWYEGIHDRFGTEDQLYAYWAGIAAGAHGHAYGAHGVWNAGDGRFLGHWGRQTLGEAMALPTGRLLGASHAVALGAAVLGPSDVIADVRDGTLVAVERTAVPDGGAVTFIPDVTRLSTLPAGRMFVPTTGRFSAAAPRSGAVVVLTAPPG